MARALAALFCGLSACTATANVSPVLIYPACDALPQPPCVEFVLVDAGADDGSIWLVPVCLVYADERNPLWVPDPVAVFGLRLCLEV